MINHDIAFLKEGIVKHFKPRKIILFGSQAGNTASVSSDIDLCIVTDEANKEAFEDRLNWYVYDSQGLNFSKPVDLLIYTNSEWEESIKDPGTFASLIKRKGVMLYGG